MSRRDELVLALNEAYRLVHEAGLAFDAASEALFAYDDEHDGLLGPSPVGDED